MASHDEMASITKRGSASFGRAEMACETLVKEAGNLEQVMRDAVAAGMVDDAGFDVMDIINRLRMLVGKVGEISSEIHSLHAKGVEVAALNSVDTVGDLIALGGGGRRRR